MIYLLGLLFYSGNFYLSKVLIRNMLLTKEPCWSTESQRISEHWRELCLGMCVWGAGMRGCRPRPAEGLMALHLSFLSLLNLLYYCFCVFFFFSVLGSCGILTPQLGNWTHTPCIGMWSLNHYTIREIPTLHLILVSPSGLHFSLIAFCASLPFVSSPIFFLKVHLLFPDPVPSHMHHMAWCYNLAKAS